MSGVPPTASLPAQGHLETLVAHLPDLVFRLDHELRYLFVSPLIEGWTGIPPEKFIGKTGREMEMEGAAWDLFEAAALRVLSRGQPEAVSFTDRGRRLRSRLLPERDASGRLVSLVGITGDITDQVQTDGALRISEEKFAKVFHGSTVAMAITRMRDGLFIEINDRWLEVTRFARENVVGKTSVGLNFWKDPNERKRFVRELTTHGAVRNELYQFVRPGGEEWTGLVSAQVSEFDGEEVIISWIVDFTERKFFEEALRESEMLARARAAELQTVLDTVPAAVWIARDPRGDHIDANRFGADLLRRAPGTNVSLSAPGDDRPRNFRVARNGVPLSDEELPIQAAARQGIEIRGSEMELVFDDGTLVHLLGNAAPVRGAEGAVRGSVGAFIDITEQKQASAERDRLAAQRHLALNAANLGWFSYEGQTGLTTLDRCYAEILGVEGPVRWSREEILKLIHPDDRARVTATLDAALDPKDPRPYATEYRVIRPDGQLRWVEVHGIAKFEGEGSSGRVASFVGIVADVTMRKETERALKELDRRKNEFLAVLSHELRNPLAPIRNSVHLLDRAPPGSGAAVRAREVLKRQVDHLTRLADDLLDLTRVDHGKIELRMATLDAREVVRRACADAAGLFGQRDVDLESAEAGEPLWVQVDRARLTQMVGNLVTNALKFTPPGGRVRVGVHRRGVSCEVSVSDTGVGIEPENLERIFEPFVQSERTRHGQGGLGIGLALVRELAARQGASVHAESAGPGKGSEFIIQLPLADPPPPPVGARDERATVGLSILIVEDNEEAAATLAEVLALKGHRTTFVGTGRGGTDAVASRVPDVLLCDVGLPDMEGYDVIRTVRSMPGGKSVFAIALTGYAQPQDENEAVAAGFDAHLAKPASPEELDALLVKAARLRSGLHGRCG